MLVAIGKQGLGSRCCKNLNKLVAENKKREREEERKSLIRCSRTDAERVLEESLAVIGQAHYCITQSLPLGAPSMRVILAQRKVIG
jgi:hypothetical protein